MGFHDAIPRPRSDFAVPGWLQPPVRFPPASRTLANKRRADPAAIAGGQSERH